MKYDPAFMPIENNEQVDNTNYDSAFTPIQSQPTKVTKSGIDQSYQTTDYGRLGTAGKFTLPRTASEASALDVKSQQKYKPTFPFESGKDITTSSSLITNPLPAVAKTVGNIPSSTLQMGKDLVSLVTSPVQTVKGIKGLVTGAIQKAIPGYQADEKYVDSLVENYKERYGSYDNLKRTIVNDPMGFGSELFALLQGGATAIGKGKQFNSLVSKTGQLVTKPTTQLYNNAKNMAVKLNNKLYGGISQTGEKSANLAYSGNKDYMAAARGKVTPDEIANVIQETANNLTNKFDDIKFSKNTEYGKAMSELDNLTTPIPKQPITDKLNEWLSNNKIKVSSDGTLDFNSLKSKFRLDAQGKQMINNVYQDLKSFPDTLTPGETNLLQQGLTPLYKESGSARSLITQLQQQAKSLLDSTPEYSNVTSKYKKALSDMASLEDEISGVNKLLSNGDVDTAIKKLTKIVKSDSQGKKVVLDLIKKETGKDIIPTVLGSQASPWMSRFGKKALEFGAIGSMFGKFNSKALLLLSVTSPRIVSEFLNALGYTERSLSKVGSTIANIKIPAATTGVVSATKNIPYLPKSK